MRRYVARFIAGALEGTAQQVSAPNEAAALERLNVLVAGSKQLQDRGTVYLGHRMTEEGEVIGCAAVVDLVPNEEGKGRYASLQDRQEKQPQDRGGSTRKHRSPAPFTRRVGANAPALRGSDGVLREAVTPSSGTYCNRAEYAAAQRDLAAAGLGTLNGRGFGTAVMVQPEHFAGVRNVKTASSEPLAILAARVTPRSDSDPRDSQPKGYDPSGDAPAPAASTCEPLNRRQRDARAAAVVIGRFFASAS